MRGKVSLAGVWFDLSSAEFSSKHGISRERFVGWALTNAEMEAIQIAGEVVGVMAAVGRNIHIAVSPDAPKEWHGAFTEFMRRNMEKHGYLVGITDSTDGRARRFIERAGCELSSDDGIVARYVLRPETAWFREG